MDKVGTVDGNYVNYSRFVITTAISIRHLTATVNGMISTYYLDDGFATIPANSLTIKNSTIHGMIYSVKTAGYSDRVDEYTDRLVGYDFYTDAFVDTNWRDGDVFTLNIDNSTIDDNYEHYT